MVVRVLQALRPAPTRHRLAAALIALCAGGLPAHETSAQQVAAADVAVEDITVPADFRIDVFAEKLGGVRALAVDAEGVLLASIPALGRVVALPDRRGLGRATDIITVVDNLELPHGLVVRAGYLYVAETGRIVRYRYDPLTLSAVEPTVVVADLPHAGHHWTRSLAFGPDGRLYVAIGSSCDACDERDPRRATIMRYRADGSGAERFASGLRNPVGLAFHPRTRALWTTVNERDWPGGGAPPDYVTEVRHTGAYGWPRCFAERHAFWLDPTFARGAACRGLTLPSVELPPHAAPLGLAFYTGAQFPREYAGNLLVALHGSRVGLPPSGYKIVRIRARAGRPGALEDFSTGWRRSDRVVGRPVDLVVGREGALYVSDDHGDRVHRVTYVAR